MNKEDIHAGQEGAENQHEKPAGCLWPLLWLILCLPIVPIVAYTLFVLLMSYQNERFMQPEWPLGRCPGLARS